MGARLLLTLTLLSCFCLSALAATTNYYLVVDYVVGTGFNGVNKTSLVINGTSPGPLLSGTIGDTFVITVWNNLPVGVSLHWHGILQTNTNPSDGVSGVTQCLIYPNTSFVYTFTLNQTGTYWYHGHAGTLYTDGLRGPLIIYNNPEVYANLYDEEIILQITDWYNQASWTLLPVFLSPENAGQEPVPDSTLINGVGYFDCRKTTQFCVQKPRISGSITITPGKRYRIRIINEAAISDYHMAIDGHNMTIIEADGIDYEPYVTQNLEINVAQRYSVIITADQAVSNYWIRVFPMASQYFGPKPRNIRVGTIAKMILNYQGATVQRPTTKKNKNSSHQDMLKLVPYGAPPAPGPVNVRYTLSYQFGPNAVNTTVAFVNNVSYSPDNAVPYIYGASYRDGNFGSPFNGSVYPLLKRGDVVELVILNLDGTNHPLHMHGHVFAVLGTGPLPYDPATAKLNLVNPPLRDVATSRTGYWMVWRFVVDNPGTWLWHCHIIWHLSTGLAVIFNELPQEQLTSFTPVGGNITACLNVPTKFPVDF